MVDSKINPKVSVWTQERNPYKGESLTIMDLYTVLKQCEIGISTIAQKGKSGSVFPYLSNIANPSSLAFDGVIFVDIDNCANIADTIYDSFDEICELVPCLLAMNYSYSHNLHFYVYDTAIKNDPSKYGEKAILYLTALAAAVKKITGIDLRNIEGALDDHSKSPYQRMFLNRSEFKWNIYCTSTNFGKDTIKKLKAEYNHLYNITEGRRVMVETKQISNDGSTVIDRNFNLMGYGCGYDARTYIAAAVYFHFKEDVNKSREYLSKMFGNAEQINQQMTSMIANNRIANKFRKDVEEYLFGSNIGDVYTLKEGEYLSDVIDISSLNGNYYYIQSNTGTGKTEFVKEFLKNSHTNVIIIQITKALRDGKSKGIEGYTYGNWATIADKSKIHTTIEGAVRNCLGMDLGNHTIVVDESHLLEEYINVRRDITRDLLTILEGAGKVIFMSATPKSDINLFNFKKLTFQKIQPQDIKIYNHPMIFDGKGSKEASEYESIISYVKSLSAIGEKVIIFSNKKQESWKKYGLENEQVTYFNAENINNQAVQSILQNNSLTNNITLSTKYMGCGVEVKGLKEIHIVFNLNEGFDKDFIIQSIGRPRCSGGVERVIVHFFYGEGRKWVTSISSEDITKIEDAFKNLVIDIDGTNTLNILAAKMINIFDPEFNTYSVKDKIEMLWTGNYINERIFYNPYSIDVLRKLPYRNIEVINLPTQHIDTDGKVRRIRKEDELLDYLKSIDGNDLLEIGKGEGGYEKALNSGDIPFNDPVNARKVIQDVKYIVRAGLNLSDALGYFEEVKRAAEALRSLMTYARVQAGVNTIYEFDGSEKAKENLEKEFDKVKAIFTEQWINKMIDKFMGIADVIEVDVDDVFAEVLGVPKEKKKGIEIFNHSKYTDAMSKKVGGKISSPKKAVKIERISDGEVFEFNSKGEAMGFLGWASQKFSEFIKNGVDKKQTFKLL